jgi:hypothetical protein
MDNFATLSAEDLDQYRRDLEGMQARGWDFDACQVMLDAIDGELAVRMQAAADIDEWWAAMADRRNWIGGYDG